MEWESSLELENLVSTPIDAGLPFHYPSPDLPPFQPSHMNIDQLQSQHGDLLFSAVAMESESSFELDNLVSTPIDAGFPFHSPSPDLPPVQPSHMNIDQLQSQQGDLRPSIAAMELEVEPSLDVGAEFPLPSSSEPPPVQPSHRNIGDQLKSAAAQSREPLDPSSNPTDLELVENLRPVVRALGLFPEQSLQEALSVCRRGLPNIVVNAGLPLLNPSELPGIKAGEKYFYLTDNHQVSGHFMCDLQIPNGFWRQNSLGSPVIDNSFRIVGFKKTYKFFIRKDPLQCTKGVETNWTMDVYSVMTKAYREDELVLCRVFERQPGYGPRLKWPTSLRICHAKHIRPKWSATFTPSNTSFNPIDRESSSMHHGPCGSRDPRLNSYLAMFEEVLLGDGDPHPDSSMETGHYMPTRVVSPADDRRKLHERKRISIVWDYFTKIYARDLEGNVVTLAVCNHCSNVLTADSKSGTTHLARHTCPCKLKPVPDRKDKGTVNVLSSQAS